MTPLINIARNCLAIALQDLGTLPAAHVQRDSDGVPVAWRLFAFGPFSITQDGKDFTGTFTAQHADAILASAEAKGVPIPIDAHHALHHVATALGIDEDALAAAIPSNRLTIGFGRLERRGDELWLADIDWTDIGRKLMAGGFFRYFSVALRGLRDGRLRITSTAVTNNPAINNLDAIAAEADTDSMERDTLSLSDLPKPKPKGPGKAMKRILEHLKQILGLDDAIALADDGAAPEPVIAALTDLAAELPALRAGKQAIDSFVGGVRDALALGDSADLATIQGAILGLSEKSKVTDALQAQVDALALEAETRKKTEVTERGRAQGKLTDAMIGTDWYKAQDSAALEGFLSIAHKVVPTGKPVDKTKLPADEDTLALSDDEREFQRAAGLTDEQMKEVKKLAAA